jgi:hypothetical protein
MNLEALFAGQIVHNGIPTCPCCGYQCDLHAPGGHFCNCTCSCPEPQDEPRNDAE